jgi:hypothetical protein
MAGWRGSISREHIPSRRRARRALARTGYAGHSIRVTCNAEEVPWPAKLSMW